MWAVDLGRRTKLTFVTDCNLLFERADANSYINGWYANMVRQRLQALLEIGVPEQFKFLESKHDKAIVHADFSKLR